MEVFKTFQSSLQRQGYQFNWTKLAVSLFLVVASIVFITLLVTLSSNGNNNSSPVLQQSYGQNNLDLTILGHFSVQEGQKVGGGKLKLGAGKYNVYAEETEEDPIVRIPRQGQVRGTILQSREGRKYYAFYAIPYADDNYERYEPAPRPRRWRGVRNATKPGPTCIQKEKYAPVDRTIGVEECLHVNIYTPVLPQGRRDKPNLPVLFYIHGGGPFGNGTRYGAKYFMDEDVILITVEYRVASFGAFTTGTENFPGNNELKDQVVAMQWVRDKIDKFGGDPDKVTIFGHSGGAAAINAHLISPLSSGLFHRAIQQSGGVQKPSRSVRDPVLESKTFSTEIGCGNTTSVEEDWVACMRNVSAEDIALSPGNLRMYGAYVDAWEGNPSVFFPAEPWTLLKNGPLNSVPLIVGLVSQEMGHSQYSTYLFTENGTNYLNDNWNEIIEGIVGIPDDENHTMAKKFKQVYFGDKRIDNDTRNGLFDLQSDAFAHSVRVETLAYKNVTDAPVYMYWLTKEPARSYGEAIKDVFDPPYGVNHADELQYLFLYDGYPEITKDSEWYPFSRKLVKIWSTFADTGEAITDTPNVEWPEIDPEERALKFLELGDEIKLVEPFTTRMQLWDEYIPQIYENKNGEEEEPAENEEDAEAEVYAEEGDDPVLRISRQGRARGTVLQSRQGRNYYAFYAIPYADDNYERFEAAPRAKRWRGIKNFTEPGPECLQKEKYSPINITAGSEECLHVNIYTPVLPQGRRDRPNLPVLFYIHGGSPFGNGTRYGGKYFMDEDVVLVTIEFRLGSFGGFTTGTSEFPGNQQYKDQVTALKWIRENIQKFGGNPEKVLIFGNSAGGVDVQAHLMSPLSTGLFHRAAVQSGSVLVDALSKSDPVEKSRRLSEQVGCGNSTTVEEDWIACMRKVSAEDIALSPAHLEFSGLYVDDFEDNQPEDTIFLPDTPWNLLSNGPLNSVPLIAGLNSQEMAHGEYSYYLLTENGTDYLNQNWDQVVQKITGIEDDEEHTVARKFKQVYFGDKRIDNDTRNQLFDLQSDAFMNHPVRVSTLLYKNVTNAPVYMYWLTKEPARSYGEAIKDVFGPSLGVSHADELQYLFLYYGYPEIDVNSPWYDFSRKLVKIWATFADTGKPAIPGEENVEWPEISLADRGMKLFELGDEMKVVEPFTRRMELWDEYIPQLYEDS